MTGLEEYKLDMPAEINFILTLMLDFFLYTSTPMRKSYDEACNGLDVDSINRITLRGKAFWLSVPDKVIELKTNLLKFLTLDAILPVDLSDHRTLLCVVGGADPHHLVQDAADECTRRYPKPSLESQEIVESLMTLYQGSNLIFEFHHDKLPPCSGLIQRKVLDLLCKSVLAANQTERATLIAINAIIRKSSSVKLRWAGMAFLQWIFRMADDGKILASISFDMLKGLVSDKSSEVDGTSKAFAYEAISLLAGRCPALFSNDTTMLKFLFQKLVDEAGQVSFAVLDALKVMVPAFSTLAKSQWKDDILKLLLKYVFHEQKKVRHAAVYYASRMFSFFVPKSRMICLLASCDPKLEIREEALQGMALPQSEDCSERISEQALLFPTYAAEILAILETQLLQPEYAVVHGNVGFINSIPVNVYSNILCFVRGILLRHGFAALTTIEYDEAHLELPFGSEKSFQMFLNTALSTSGPENTAVAGYSEWITRGILAKQADARLISVGASLSLEILSHGPNELTVSHRKHVGWIGNFLASFNPVTRIKFAHILALVSTSDVSLNADMFTKDLAQFIKQSEDTTSQAVSLRHGSLAAIGFIIGRITFRHPNNFFEFVKIEVIQEALSSLISALNESSMIISVACIAIAELTRYICLEENPVISPSLLTMHTRLIEIVKNPSEIKNQEGALLAISHMSHKNKNLGIETMKMYESLPAVFSKQVETYFNCGEAICATMFGFQSTHMLQYLDITGLPTPKFQGIEECAKEAAFDSFINMAKPQSSVISRKAASVWLLCLLKFCSGNALIKRRMIQLHACFSSLLNDSDEFTQEIASKGIGLVYDLGDQDVKDSLVRGLVGNLTEGRKAQAQSVTADTQLFASSIGTTPDGSKISTYQSVLSLAADMNQPDLVYKFMSLASHHQIWNSRRGASMGFSSIARQAEAELLPHLPKIVPRLYRFRFDPNPKIAESMKNIWRTLVQNPTQTVNSCFDAILCEILKGMTEDAWRTRESSCSALADLLPGRLIEELEPYMTQLWSVSFRAFDDIKDSVRKAALSSCKTLTSITLRNCSDTCSNKTLSGRLVGTMVPFLLNSGLGSMSEDVRNLSLGTILKLCKQGGALLKPHITDIVYSLLEALSSIEPQMMNYLSFHTDKYNITQEQLDMSRLSAAKSSPILEAVECTIAHIDADILSQLVPKLCHLVRKGVGLPTRAGCARFIYYLTSRCPNDLKPHADTILKALSHAIHDRSIVVRKSYSVAVGHVAKLCSEGALETLMSHLKVSYLEAEDENEKSVAGITMLEMTRHSPETMKDFHNVLLPLAFMGLSDVSDASMAKVWQAVWDENTAGSTTAIKMWAKELIDECEAVLQNSPSWTLKKQVGKCMTEIAKANGSNNNITARCFELLKGSLTGRTWDGKEAILEAYAMTVVEGKEYFLSNPSEQQIVEDVVIREALKKNKAYRRVALQYLGDVFEALSSNRFEEVEAYLLECACDSTIDDMDVDEDRQKPMMLAIQSNAFKAIGKCFPKESHLQAEMCSRIQFKLCSSLIGNPWNVRISVIEAMEKIFSKLDDRAQDAVFQRQLVDRVFEALLECIQDQKYSSLREKSVSCMSTMLEQFMKTALFSGYKARIYDALALLANKETGSVQHGLKQLMTSIQLYKGKV